MPRLDPDLILEAREAIYASAFDSSPWQKTLSLLGQITGAHSGCLTAPTYEAERGLIEAGFGWGVDLKRADAFARRSGVLDPWSQAVAANNLCTPGIIVTGSALCSEHALKDSPWWDGYFKPFGNGDLLAMFCDPPPGSNTQAGVVALHRAPGETPFSMADGIYLEALRPDIERAMRASLALQKAERELRLAREALDGLAIGVFLVDAAGCVLEHNAAGERMLSAGAPLSISGGPLKPSDPTRHSAFAAFVERAVVRGKGGDLLITGCAGSRFVVTITPLAGAQYESARALVIVANALAQFAERAEPLRHRYGLTQAEVEIAGLLAQGHAAAAISAARGVAKETTRGQLKSLFDKLGVHSQVAAAVLIAATLAMAAGAIE